MDDMPDKRIGCGVSQQPVPLGLPAVRRTVVPDSTRTFDFLGWFLQDVRINAKRFTIFGILGVLGGSLPVPKVLKMSKRKEHRIQNSTSPPPESLQQSPAELLSFPHAADDDF